MPSPSQQMFAGKVVIVTGSSSGIGQAAAVMFGREGASVVIHGQDAARLQETQDMMVSEGVDPARILQVIGSMEAEDTPQKLLTATLAKFQRIDVLVNNAAALKGNQGTDPLYINNLDQVYRVNFRAVVELTQLCLPELIKSKGNIVNVSSVGSTCPLPPPMTFYSSLKAALDHFTRNYAVLYSQQGVRINCLNPGPIQTYIWDRNTLPEKQELQSNALDKWVEEVTAMKRWGTVEEMASIIKFLAGPDSSYMTGACLIADGGMQLYSPKI